MEYILETVDVTKKYDGFTLNPVNLRVPYGKIVGLIGENGAGKTTYLSIILNQIKCDGGNVKLFGLDSTEHDVESKKSIGFVVDECCFHICLNAQNINSIMKGIYEKWSADYFFSLLQQFEINPNKKVGEFSKGMKSKLMLAVALAHSPRLLILDEITSGLDPIVRDDIMVLLKEYVSSSSSSVLFSTHVTSDLDKAADEVALLHNGQLVFYNTIQEIRSNYRLSRCSQGEYSSISRENIIRVLFRDDRYSILLDGEKSYSFKTTTPSLDDIMLLYIKGEKA